MAKEKSIPGYTTVARYLSRDEAQNLRGDFRDYGIPYQIYVSSLGMYRASVPKEAGTDARRIVKERRAAWDRSRRAGQGWLEPR